MRCAALFLLLTFFTHGQQPDSVKPYLLNDVTVTAVRGEINTFDAPAEVITVNSRQFGIISPVSLNDIMKLFPGTALQRTTLGGGSPILRGMTGRENLILVDGIRINNSVFRSGPTQYFNTIDHCDIERVEIVHGPSSVLYGSDAMGGVINVITKNPPDEAAAVKSSSVYSGNSFYQSLSAATAFKSGGIIINTAFKHFDDLTAGGGLVQAPTGFDEFDGSVKLKINTGFSSDLSFLMQSVNQKHVPRYDRIAAGKDLKNEYNPQQRHLLYGRYKGVTGSFINNYEITFSLQRMIEGSGIISAEQKDIEVTEKINLSTLGGGAVFHSLLSSHLITGGGEFYYDIIKSSRDTLDHAGGFSLRGNPPLPPGSKYLSSAFFLQDHYEKGNIIVISGLRYSYFSYSAVTVQNGQDKLFSKSGLCGSVDLTYKIIKNRLNFYASVSQGFRAPNANDLSGVGLISNYGLEVSNPDLTSEKLISYEAGLKLSDGGSARVDISGYYMRLYDFIDRRELSGTKTFQKVNSARGEVSGIALTGYYYPFPQILLTNFLSYTIGSNLSYGEPLSRVPPLRGAFSAELNTGPLAVRAALEYSTPQHRISANDKKDTRIGTGGTPGYLIFDMYLLYSAAPWLTAAFSVENLFDRLYKIHGSGIYSTGRNFIISVNIQFTRVPL